MIVNRMFQRCLDDGQFKQAIGIAIESRRMDIFKRAILESVRVQTYIISSPAFWLNLTVLLT